MAYRTNMTDDDVARMNKAWGGLRTALENMSDEVRAAVERGVHASVMGTPPAPDDMPFPDLCRHAARQAAFATGQLLQADEPADLIMEETPEILADALRSTLQAAATCGTLPDADAQLLGALERYLDGWAG